YPQVYYADPSIIYYSTSSYPVSLQSGTGVYTGATMQTAPMPRADETAPPPRPLQEDRTYPYDGGPPRQIPMPNVGPDGVSAPKPPTVPLEGSSVSLTKKSSHYAYAAYGEDRLNKNETRGKDYLVKEKAK